MYAILTALLIALPTLWVSLVVLGLARSSELRRAAYDLQDGFDCELVDGMRVADRT
jgi:hypothetical protein